ncbi:MAG: class I SAM-dependent methyltransferase [Solirubrobacteraceae bacterium]
MVPLDPSRYLELPHTLRQLKAQPGERVLDLASPKLAAVALARSGVQVTSMDAFEAEVETLHRPAGGESNLSFACEDGRDMPYGEASFDHAFSISVLEHIPGDGDERALAEMARVVRPGGRVVLTMPYSDDYWEDWRDIALYGEDPNDGDFHFFERWYDDDRLERLLGAAPALRITYQDVVSMHPDLHGIYTRQFPRLIPLGPLFGLMARERPGPPGDIVRLTLVKDG